ncbi:MAG: tRNA lysidine(34) synthetase TilS [Alicyclobacillus sp.]|nr:tRNA lysidine(34) synthetase TilS [Alicyclobacillus sp.]
MHDVRRTVSEFLDAHALWPTQDGPIHWFVAYSGGVDSTVLLHVLRDLVAARGGQLTAVHVEHGLRARSTADAAFVQQVCREADIPLVVRSVRVTDIPRSESGGVEADARRLRYDALADVATSQAEGAQPVVFLGHHADDQVETVLLRFLRGTSLTGLAGIRPVREWRRTLWARPLLSLEKRALVSAAEAAGWAYVEDESNEMQVFARNFLRHRVIPELRRLQPELARVVGRAAALAQAEDRWLDEQAERLYRACAVQRGRGTWEIQCHLLAAAPLPLQRRAIKLLLNCLPSTGWTFDHVESILHLCTYGGPSAELHLPHGTRARRVYETLVLTVDSGRGESARAEVRPAPPRSWDPAVERAVDWESPVGGAWRFTSRVCCGAASAADAGRPFDRPFPATLHTAVFPFPVQFVIRPAQPGERVELLGLNGSKKVQDIFVDHKVPRGVRPGYPCLFVGDDLVWVPGLARSRRHCLVGDEAEWLEIAAVETPPYDTFHTGIDVR